MRRLLRFLFPRHGNFRAERARADRLAEALRVITARTYPATYLGEAKDGTRMYGGSDDASRYAAAALAEYGSPEEPRSPSPLHEVIAEVEHNAKHEDPFLAVILDDAASYLRRLQAAEQALEDIATRQWRDEGGRIAAAVARDGLSACRVLEGAAE